MKASQSQPCGLCPSDRSSGPTPALLCDCCEWPMSAHEIARSPDGSIPGLLVCSVCTEDNLNARSFQ